MVWVSAFPNKYRVWGGLSFGPSFSRTMVWVSSREGRNTGVGVDERTLNLVTFVGDENWTQTFFSQTFRAPPGYPGKIAGYPAQKVWFPWFRGTYRTFRPPLLHVEDPHPTAKYPDPKVWVWVPFLPEQLVVTTVATYYDVFQDSPRDPDILNLICSEFAVCSEFTTRSDSLLGI